MRKNIWSYFVLLRQGGGGGVHPTVFVSQSEKVSKCLTQIFFWFSTRFTRKKIDYSKGSVRKNICSYFVSLRQEGRGGGPPQRFCLTKWKNEQMFDTDFFLFFVFNIKAREKHTLGKTIWRDNIFSPWKKSNLWRFDFEISHGLEVVLRAFFRNIFTGSVFVSTNFSKFNSGNCHG